MAKKRDVFGFLYLIGMALVVVGFCCPMIKGLFGSSANGFKFINFDRFGFVTIGAILIFAGAVAGVVASFIPNLGALKILFLICSIAGGIILVVGFMTNGGIYKMGGKLLLKNATWGFYLACAGWIIALCSTVKR